MKKHLAFLSCAILLGGLVSAHDTHILSPTETTIQKDVALTKCYAAPITIVAVAKMDYTPCEVIRPRTAMLVIEYGDVTLPELTAPVCPVANSPPQD